MNQFVFKSEEFEGPLALLLDLIEKRKLCINDISLAAIADQYLSFVQTLPALSLEKATNFISVAATLMLIKSLSLLPSLPVTEEEAASIDDLEARLREYQRVRELSRHVQERFGVAPLFLRGRVNLAPVFSPTKEITKASLLASFKDLLARIPAPAVLPKKALAKLVSLEEVVATLVERMAANLKMRFSDVLELRRERGHVIVSFLAVLELVKRGIILAHQEAHFSDIQLETRVVGTPRYEA